MLYGNLFQYAFPEGQMLKIASHIQLLLRANHICSSSRRLSLMRTFSFLMAFRYFASDFLV